MEKKQLQAVPGLPLVWMSKGLELAMVDPTLALRLIRLSVHGSLALRGAAVPRTKAPKPQDSTS